MSAEDTVLVSSCVSGHKVTIPIPQGTHITVDVVGLHYNREALPGVVSPVRSWLILQRVTGTIHSPLGLSDSSENGLLRPSYHSAVVPELA